MSDDKKTIETLVGYLEGIRERIRLHMPETPWKCAGDRVAEVRDLFEMEIDGVLERVTGPMCEVCGEHDDVRKCRVGLSLLKVRGGRQKDGSLGLPALWRHLWKPKDSWEGDLCSGCRGSFYELQSESHPVSYTLERIEE